MTRLLTADALYKHYAGVIAVDEFSITLNQGEIHALIGPNGAGKSTAIGLLTGEIRADTGTISLFDADITTTPCWQRARAGIGRTYQITSVIHELNVLENMLIALLADTHNHRMGLSSPYRHRDMLDQAVEILERFNLHDSSQKRAGELSHGEQGRLEIAMCIATSPKVLLLDEPMSGMSLLDGEKMILLLSRIKTSTAILLVEHDMEAVFKLADRISVMASGRIIASGEPQVIRNNPQVIEAYLGEFDA